MDILIDNYETETDLETPDFLSETPLSVLKENVRYQFNEVGWIKVDYMAFFLKSYEYSKECVEDDDETSELDDNKDEFLLFMTEIFKSKLHIGFPNLLDSPTEDQKDLLHFTYRFFILAIRDNFLNFIWNYISDHREELLNIFEIRKDITSLAYKKELRVEDVAIISNLSSIMEYILKKEDVTVDDFLLNCDSRKNESRLETVIVCEGFDSYNLTGNFFSPYAKMLDDILKKEIESIIRSRILKEYRSGGDINE